MRPKDYLLQAQKARAAARDLGERIEELRTAAAGIKAITYDKDKVQVSPRDYMPDVIAELIELEEEYARRIIKYNMVVLDIEERISRLNDSRYVDILRYRYLSGMTWEQIATEKCYSFRHVIRLHGAALQEFARQNKDVLLCHTR